MVAPTTRLLLLSATFAGLLGTGGCGRALAQSHGGEHAFLPFRQLSTADGLAQNHIASILQDRQGYLWFGTREGLSRYDGRAFVTYRHDPLDSTSLSTNGITDIAEGDRGHLWVLAEGALNRLDRRRGRVARYAVRAERIEHDGRGGLWMKSRGEVFRVDATGTTTKLPGVEGVVDRIVTDDEGTLWVTVHQMRGGAGAYRLDPAGDRTEWFAFPAPITRAYALAPDTAGGAWLASGRDVYHLDGRAGTTTFVARMPETVVDLAAARAPFDGAWVLTDAELARVERGEPSVRRYPLRRDATPAIAAVLHVDREGAVWIGTMFHGAIRYDPYVKPFVNLSSGTEWPVTLASEAVMALHESADGTLWVGTLGGGLHRFSPDLELTAHYAADPDDPRALCDDDVWDLHEDAGGVLWIGTGRGLCALDRRSGQMRTYRLPPGGYRGRTVVTDIQEDPSGDLWLALADMGLARFSPRSGQLTRYPRKATPDGTGPSGMVQTVHLDRSGRLWVGTQWGGLNRFDPHTGRFTYFPSGTLGPDGTSGDTVWHFHERADGRLWIATDQGVDLLDPATGTFRHLGVRDGLPGDETFFAVPDDAGALWVGTNHGLARVVLAADTVRTVRTFLAADGLRNIEFNRKAWLRLRSGELLFGGTRGITRLDPRQMRESPQPPPIVLTRFECTGRDGVRATGVDGRAEVVVKPTDHAFRFAFAALSYTNPRQNRFAYRLEGFDEAWVEAGTRDEAYYTNVPPGRYRFRVRGANSDGVWNEAGAAIRVTVLPPYWQTWWFRLLVLGGVMGLLAAAYRYRVRHLLEVERLRLRIAQDLHDDVGANLGSIALMGELLAEREPLSERGRRQMADISRTARRISEELDDIVWLTAPRHDDLGDLVARMEETASALLGHTRYSFEASLEALGGRIGMAFRRHVYLIYKEVLHNAATHAAASRVEIWVGERGGQLVMRVRDDGVGFEAARPGRGHGNGLVNMQSRAEQLGGTLRVESRPGAGTAVELYVPLA